MRDIRRKMGYSIEGFAELLGLKTPTYKGYETGRRKTPPEVLQAARDAYKRDRKFFVELPKRVDKELQGRSVPNECRPGEW